MENFNLNLRSRNKNDLYYDALESLDGTKAGAKTALKFLNEALKMDPESVQTYIGFISAYEELGDTGKRAECTKKSFELTKKKFPKWPDEMPWGVLENREYMRAIQFMAEDFEELGEKDKAVELYRLLLIMNPGDNQGVRYVLAGLYAGISGYEINSVFDKGNEKQNWDKLEELVKIQNKKHKFWKPPNGNNF